MCRARCEMKWDESSGEQKNIINRREKRERIYKSDRTILICELFLYLLHHFCRVCSFKCGWVLSSNILGRVLLLLFFSCSLQSQLTSSEWNIETFTFHTEQKIFILKKRMDDKKNNNFLRLCECIALHQLQDKSRPHTEWYANQFRCDVRARKEKW